jgi:signal transduction histidine kinase
MYSQLSEPMALDLLGTVSHELRSPLASIKGYAATLLGHEHRLAREERHQFLLAINEASDRLEIIVARLLEDSQLETGQIMLERSPVDMARLANEAIAVIQERMTASRPGCFVFGLRLENADGTSGRSVPHILADPRRLREVLDHLLENACNYSPDGGQVTVTIRPVVQPLAQGRDAPHTSGEHGPAWAPVPRTIVEVCVTDQGRGIPTEHLDKEARFTCGSRSMKLTFFQSAGIGNRLGTPSHRLSRAWRTREDADDDSTPYDVRFVIVLSQPGRIL